MHAKLLTLFCLTAISMATYSGECKQGEHLGLHPISTEQKCCLKSHAPCYGYHQGIACCDKKHEYCHPLQRYARCKSKKTHEYSKHTPEVKENPGHPGGPGGYCKGQENFGFHPVSQEMKCCPSTARPCYGNLEAIICCDMASKECAHEATHGKCVAKKHHTPAPKKCDKHSVLHTHPSYKKHQKCCKKKEKACFGWSKGIRCCAKGYKCVQKDTEGKCEKDKPTQYHASGNSRWREDDWETEDDEDEYWY